ncbi:MAG: hypothetical protein US11_C0001G0015 [Candidatus Roizmanbacteria bacterium GW2011_GWA2_36_23]|uniref:Uncharacterized protein n=1 Tax=Candidatus Roizmanbacteria bacterium GW2011_GWA2_36_23 TaxID=1618480 RepID=A0A0G0HDN5_9BACT|nr:MAG: hypothetical protein US11_C0001G0015 [Candidatus Roizmanbacteria bacterium GW2011_GWA2_36_23]
MKRNLIILLFIPIFIIGVLILNSRVQSKKILSSAPTPESKKPESTLAVKPTSVESTIVPTITLTALNTTNLGSVKVDTTPPEAYILEPKNNSEFVYGTEVKIVANVTDNIKVDRVEFYAGSSDYQLIGIVRTSPYEVNWKLDSRFEHSINIPVYIKAFDTSGNRNSNIGGSITVRAKNP